MADRVEGGASGQQASSLFAYSLLAVLLIGLGFGTYKLFSSASPQVAAAIVAGSATVLVSVLSLILNRRSERQRDLEQEIRQKKIPIYEDFMRFWFRVFHGSKPGVKALTPDEMTQFFMSFPEKLIVWGPDKLVSEYAAFRRKHFMEPLQNPPPEKVASMILDFEQLLYTLRADIGHINEGLKPTDLLALFMTDIEEVTAADKQGRLPKGG